MEGYMQPVQNERGSVLIFATLIIVLLLIMVGMGLDTGHVAYVRSQGQPAVDSAALAAASAIPSGDMTKVTGQAAKFNPGAAGNPGAGNDYVSSSNPSNKIGADNVTLVKYNNITGTFITSGVTIDPSAPSNVRANGVRVALENNNPHGGTAGAAMQAPLFLTPLFNLFGQTTSTTADVSTSAVAVIRALPGLPIVITNNLCGGTTVKELEFQSKNSAGWETYYIENASTSEIRALWEALPFCSGQPIVDVGYCGNMANGVNETIVNGHLKPMFKAEPNRCYLIPVINNGGNFTQCQTITDWASFCPDKIDPFPKTGTLKGTVTCGQTTWDSRDTKCYVPFLIRDTKSGM
jgi:Flp pilus assembly protein TadG